jgi:dienelactone hydrolase
VSQKFDSIGKIGQVRMPVLFVHGAEDRYVPSRLSEALYAAAPQPKKLLLIPNGTHNNSAWMGDAEYRQALRELFGPIGGLSSDKSRAIAPNLPVADGISVNRGGGRGVLDGRATAADAARN